MFVITHVFDELWYMSESSYSDYSVVFILFGLQQRNLKEWLAEQGLFQKKVNLSNLWGYNSSLMLALTVLHKLKMQVMIVNYLLLMFYFLWFGQQYGIFVIVHSHSIFLLYFVVWLVVLLFFFEVKEYLRLQKSCKMFFVLSFFRHNRLWNIMQKSWFLRLLCLGITLSYFLLVMTWCRVQRRFVVMVISH